MSVQYFRWGYRQILLTAGKWDTDPIADCYAEVREILCDVAKEEPGARVTSVTFTAKDAQLEPVGPDGIDYCWEVFVEGWSNV